MYISPPPDTDDVQRHYRANAQSQGYVMNLARAWAWRPEVFEGFAALRNLLTERSSLSKRELAVLVSATAAELGDPYCALAWGTTLAKQSTPAVARAVLDGEEDSGMTTRDSALARWARKVARDPNATQPSDVEELRQAGITEREIVEATMFIGFRLAFSTVNDALGVQPDTELVEAAPHQVREAVTFGRPRS